MTRILIVDDDPALLHALPEAVRLRVDGVIVDTADSAPVALERIGAVDYDAIVTDIKMPGMDGLALLSRIRTIRPDTPTLLITGHGEHDLAIQALRGGAYDFIQKPIDREYFALSLRRAIQVRELKRQVEEQQRALRRHAEELEQAVVARTRELQFLAEASKLLAVWLDYPTTLEHLARMTVTVLADVCVIDVVEEDGVAQVAVAHADPSRQALIRNLRRRCPPHANESHPVARVLRSGQSEMDAEVPHWLVGEATDGEVMKALLELGITSVMVVPLVARERTVGAITLAADRPDRRFGPRELALAEDLARRTALAVDNARLYQREHRVAETLQRSLLPQRLPEIPGVAVAARYRPGQPEAVGGDWYDVLTLPGWQVGLVMGDVAGRGVRAAAVMGQLRNALRAYALEGHPPAPVAERLNYLIDLGEMATILYLIFDPATWTVRYVNAGHPPPLVIGPDRSTRFLGGGAPPLGGLLQPSYREETATLAPGSTIVLYTDGLVEGKGANVDEGLRRLERAAAAGPDADLESLLDHVLTALLRDRPSGDDVALLALRASPLDPDRLELRMPAVPFSLPSLRHILRQWLETAEADPEEVYEITVACSEACTNAIEHAYNAADAIIEVKATRSGEEVVITVRDWGQWRPPRGKHRGRGLGMMQGMMDAVEIIPDPRGTTVQMRRRLRREVQR
ncbi:MAG: SpoIIE family protein phosphatase [Armatimonadetes bacterium]|nr:SpoIIE family protein phosphatase [Armatimonadota bacterium]